MQGGHAWYLCVAIIRCALQCCCMVCVASWALNWQIGHFYASGLCVSCCVEDLCFCDALCNCTFKYMPKYMLLLTYTSSHTIMLISTVQTEPAPAENNHKTSASARLPQYVSAHLGPLCRRPGLDCIPSLSPRIPTLANSLHASLHSLSARTVRASGSWPTTVQLPASNCHSISLLKHENSHQEVSPFYPATSSPLWQLCHHGYPFPPRSAARPCNAQAQFRAAKQQHEASRNIHGKAAASREVCPHPLCDGKRDRQRRPHQGLPAAAGQHRRR